MSFNVMLLMLNCYVITVKTLEIVIYVNNRYVIMSICSLLLCQIRGHVKICQYACLKASVCQSTLTPFVCFILNFATGSTAYVSCFIADGTIEWTIAILGRHAD